MRPKHADNGIGLSLQKDRLAQDVRVVLESSPPELVADHDCVRATVAVLLCGEGASDDGQLAQHIEEACRYAHRGHAAYSCRGADVGGVAYWRAEARDGGHDLRHLIADKLPGLAIDGRGWIRGVLI